VVRLADLPLYRSLYSRVRVHSHYSLPSLLFIRAPLLCPRSSTSNPARLCLPLIFFYIFSCSGGAACREQPARQCDRPSVLGRRRRRQPIAGPVGGANPPPHAPHPGHRQQVRPLVPMSQGPYPGRGGHRSPPASPRHLARSKSPPILLPRPPKFYEPHLWAGVAARGPWRVTACSSAVPSIERVGPPRVWHAPQRRRCRLAWTWCRRWAVRYA